MVCSKCDKPERNGRVIKDEFVCDKCLAAAKRASWENQFKEKYQAMGTTISRAEQMLYTTRYDLAELKEVLKINGIVIPEADSEG